MPNQIIYVNGASNSARTALVSAQNKSASMPDFIVGDDGTLTICLLDADGNFAGWDAGGELAAQYVFCVGLIGRPANLSYRLKVGADETEELTSASSPSELETALNALEGVSASGGLDVVGYAGGTFKITWRTVGAKPAIEVAAEGLPNSQVLSDVIVDGDAATRQIQAISLFVGAIAAGESSIYVSREATRIVATVVTDPDTHEESIETSTETYNVNSDLKFELSTKTIEALLALGAAENTRVRCELKHVSSAGAIRTIMTADATLYNRVCADAAQYQSLSDRINSALDEMHTYLSDVADKRDYVEGAAYGTSYGTPVDESSEFYQNNAKYFSEGAETAKTAAEDAATYAAMKSDEAQNAANAAVQAVGVRDLQRIIKSDGQFYFNGGSISTPASGMGTLPFTLSFFYAKKTAWENGDWPFVKGIASQNINGLSIWCGSGKTRITFMLRTASTAGSRIYVPVATLPTDGLWHSVVFVAPEVDVSTWKLYIDGVSVSVSRVAGAFTGDFSIASPLIINGSGVAYTDLRLARIMAFNAALPATIATDAGALGYSVEQYNRGELVPPNLLNATSGARAILALDNYSFLVGATRKIPDLSAALNEATITGNVAGSIDNQIERLAAYINP